MSTPTILFDDARPGHERLLRFAAPLALIRADAPDEIPAAFDEIESALAAGRHVAGYLSYELGYLLEPRLAPLLPTQRALPLLWFGVFDEPQEQGDTAAFLAANMRGRAQAGALSHEWNEQQYAARFARVHALIEDGDIYQANLSFRSRFAFAGDPLALYASLRQRAGAAHCAYVDDGERHILSLSPELFFTASADGRIVTRPMKGTAARHGDPAANAAARAHLVASDKERAENLMIVDLLRNDLGRVARLGSVAVEELFAVETYPTVHQMVSTVSARLRSGLRPRDIVAALFPCGSVTGAPKIRAMEVIRELEASTRGVYCGAIGWFAPDGAAAFNVAIRTLTIRGDRGELGIGGAVVYDSRSQSEYAECLLKARYFEAARTPLELIETLRWSPRDGFVRLDRHLARMAESAAFFGIPFDRAAALGTLETAVRERTEALRVRLTMAENGAFACTAVPLGPDAPQWSYMISPIRVQSGDALLRHKTSRRETFESELARAQSFGIDEVLFLNERGELTEGSRSNVFVRLDGRLVTPALSCGLLNGCLRQELLDSRHCAEAILTPADLARADEVYFGNSLRGLIRALRFNVHFPPPLAGGGATRSGAGEG
jgi:para-aminobenzoate synthetase/4-amino-4-deoxychorismate lyase